MFEDFAQLQLQSVTESRKAAQFVVILSPVHIQVAVAIVRYIFFKFTCVHKTNCDECDFVNLPHSYFPVFSNIPCAIGRIQQAYTS